MLFGTTTMCSTFASSVFSSASPYIQEEFGVGRQVVVLGISLFIGGYVLGPLLWSSLSEQYGRKGTILVPVFIFMCFTAATATAKDLQVSTCLILHCYS
jgi:DHA1 family multidrug resistance protein-like MFS transporter